MMFFIRSLVKKFRTNISPDVFVGVDISSTCLIIVILRYQQSKLVIESLHCLSRAAKNTQENDESKEASVLTKQIQELLEPYTPSKLALTINISSRFTLSRVFELPEQLTPTETNRYFENYFFKNNNVNKQEHVFQYFPMKDRTKKIVKHYAVLCQLKHLFVPNYLLKNIHPRFSAVDIDSLALLRAVFYSQYQSLFENNQWCFIHISETNVFFLVGENTSLLFEKSLTIDKLKQASELSFEHHIGLLIIDVLSNFKTPSKIQLFWSDESIHLKTHQQYIQSQTNIENSEFHPILAENINNNLLVKCRSSAKALEKTQSAFLKFLTAYGAALKGVKATQTNDWFVS